MPISVCSWSYLNYMYRMREVRFEILTKVEPEKPFQRVCRPGLEHWSYCVSGQDISPCHSGPKYGNSSTKLICRNRTIKFSVSKIIRISVPIILRNHIKPIEKEKPIPTTAMLLLSFFQQSWSLASGFDMNYEHPVQVLN